MNWADLPYIKRSAMVQLALRSPKYWVTEPFFVGDIVLRPKQLEIFLSVWETDTGQAFPKGKKKYQEIQLVAGMRSGKTFLASIILGYAIFVLCNMPAIWKEYGLAKGSEIALVVIATSQTQAMRTVWGVFINTLWEISPYFEWLRNTYARSLKEHITINMPHGKILVEALSTSGMSAVGRTVYMAFFDELAKMELTDSKRSGEFVYQSLSKSTATFQSEGQRISIGSILHDQDPLWLLYQRSQEVDEKGKPKYPSMKGFFYTTPQMNPYFDEDYLRQEWEKDPISANRDFYCIPESGGMIFYANKEIIQYNPANKNVLEQMWPYIQENWDMYSKWSEQKALNPMLKQPTYKEYPVKPRPGRMYVLAGDPAFKSDAFGIALGFREIIPKRDRPKEIIMSGVTDVRMITDRIVLDGLWRVLPKKMGDKVGEIDPRFITFALTEIARHFNVSFAVFDTWNFPTTQKTLKTIGVFVLEPHRIMKEDCERLKERQFYGTLDICKYEYILKEMRELIRVNTTKGVDHPPKGSKDVFDSAVLVQWILDVGLYELEAVGYPALGMIQQPDYTTLIKGM
jgi:hypothetical protein